jgi:hypothetical protein
MGNTRIIEKSTETSGTLMSKAVLTGGLVVLPSTVRSGRRIKLRTRYGGWNLLKAP